MTDKDQTPGSLLLAWQVKDKHCLVIGGGDVGLSRVDHMIRANAKITVVTGDKTHPDLLERHRAGKLYSLIQRAYEPLDLTMYETEPSFAVDSYKDITAAHYAAINELVSNEHFACVCCCIDDPVLSAAIYYQCKYLRIPVNIADKPPMCDFYFGLMFNQDALQIMISTNGKSPRLLKMIKDDILKKFSNIRLNDAVDNLGAIRARLREKKVPDTDLASIDARMLWIKLVLELPTGALDKIIEPYPEFPPKDYEEFKKYIA
ncbi:putative bifunctional dehydrogenase/ferrochelatase [Metschnikowia bicuspidata var. bicuspidata NRRL YB-4993]|uniref:precorrin-2 dehydrogenase n=1 Tax=Metschnikowia bicuspidata var. bicuspidata NRRL YB-4993 TaxID=869754 RepID=A0A1A0H8V0_9ASCO|nr:putative bifunctional dehydrogenase/ferrochelatase [Metschnikowia bicuspidata var. bicuspidata NRRL YB-4993]OBA20425.1 putative bifunctional dehydrogenase/ferrochelatase [Metschnikowia bicuspidata var. bicuspidata NRRL YB-4993]